MFQIVYFSKAVSAFSEDSLAALLRKARARNKKLAVTGMLVYAGGEFLQMLEGDPSAVVDTFQRISQDARHHEVVTLRRSMAYGAMMFDAWSMGFKNLSNTQHLEGGMPINGRIALSQLDEISALDFFKSCSESQSDGLRRLR